MGKQTKQSGFAPLLLIVVIVCLSCIVVVGYFYAYQYFQKNKLEGLATSTAPTLPNIVQWKTYADDKYKFSFKYPPGYTIKKENKEDLGLSGKLFIQIYRDQYSVDKDGTRAVVEITNPNVPGWNDRPVNSLPGHGNQGFKNVTIDGMGVQYTYGPEEFIENSNANYYVNSYSFDPNMVGVYFEFYMVNYPDRPILMSADQFRSMVNSLHFEKRSNAS